MEILRRAIAAVLESNPAKVKVRDMAFFMGVSESNIYRWGETSGAHIPIQRLVQLVGITKDTRPIQAICEMLGGVFIPLGHQRVQNIDVKALKEFGEFMAAKAASLEDGRITRREMDRISKEGQGATKAIAFAINTAERIFKGESAEGTYEKN